MRVSLFPGSVKRTVLMPLEPVDTVSKWRRMPLLPGRAEIRIFCKIIKEHRVDARDQFSANRDPGQQ